MILKKNVDVKHELNEVFVWTSDTVHVQIWEAQGMNFDTVVDIQVVVYKKDSYDIKAESCVTYKEEIEATEDNMKVIKAHAKKLVKYLKNHFDNVVLEEGLTV